MVGNGRVNFTDEVPQQKDEINRHGTRRQGNRIFNFQHLEKIFRIPASTFAFGSDADFPRISHGAVD